MKTISYFLIQFVSNVLAVVLCHYWLKGFSFSGSLLSLSEIALTLTFFNFLVKPILKFILNPFIILTFGLLMIAINAFGLWLVSLIFSSLTIQFGWPLIYATIIFGLVNTTLHLAAKRY